MVALWLPAAVLPAAGAVPGGPRLERGPLFPWGAGVLPWGAPWRGHATGGARHVSLVLYCIAKCYKKKYLRLET